MGAEAAVEDAVEVTTKRIVAARIEEAVDRVRSIKSVLEVASTADTSENSLPAPVARELRGTQFLLKGIAGVTKGVSFMIPGSDSMAEVTEIEAAVKKATLATLEEVERRLETLKGDLGEAEMLSPAQARKIDGAADMLGKVVGDHPTTKGLAVTKSSLDSEQRDALLKSIEKAMGDLGDLYMALNTDSVSKKSADEFEVGSLIHEAAAELETGVAKMLEGKEGGIADVNSMIENAREIAKALGDKGDEALEPVHGFFVNLRKAAQMFEVRGGWGDSKAKVVLATGDETVAEFDDRLAAEMEALKRNVELVTKTAKAGHLDKNFSTRVGGPKGYQVVDGEGNVVGDFATAEEARAEASRRNLKKNDDTNEEGGVADTTTDTDDTTDTSKVGRPMQGKRLNRLKAAAATLNEALGDLLAGSASMEKFKKAASDLADVIREVQTAKSALANRGMTDTRGTTEDAPNQGSGVQLDPDAVGDATDNVFGEGSPDMSAVLKQLDALKKQIEEGNASGETEVSKRDVLIADLQTELTQLKKRRAAPSTLPRDGDDEETEIRKRGGAQGGDGATTWGTDMNNEEWDDDGDDLDDLDYDD